MKKSMRKPSKGSIKKGTRKIYGGSAVFNMDNSIDMDLTLGNISKLSHVSEEQLFNSFYHNSSIATEKANIRRAFKMMKQEAKELKDNAKTIDNMVTRTIKVNTIIMNKAAEMARKVKDKDRDDNYRKDYEILLDSWNTLKTNHAGDDDLIDIYTRGMKKIKSPKIRAPKKK